MSFYFHPFYYREPKAEEEIKEEPDSSTNVVRKPKKVEEPRNTRHEIQFGKDYENDPEAGPSGIKTQPRRDSSMYTSRISRRYQDQYSSDDDDSDDEIAQTTSLWRSRGSFNLNQNDHSENDIPWRTRQRAASDSNSNELSQAANNTCDDVIVIEADPAQANPLASNINSGMEVLTAPDLQLDWDSSDDSVICADENVSFAQPTQRTPFARTSAITNYSIDLTGSDDEDTFSNMQAPRNRYRGLYDEYHNATNPPISHSHNVSGNLNCRSSFGTCDCLEGDR